MQITGVLDCMGDVYHETFAVAWIVTGYFSLWIEIFEEFIIIVQNIKFA